MRLFLRKGATFFMCTIALNTIFSVARAQDKNPLINSGDIIKQANKLHDDGKYKESIELLKQINRSDTNYANALYEMSYSYYSDTAFQKAFELGRKGMELFPDKYMLYSNVVANTLDDMERRDEALAIYDSSLARNPQSFLLYFNKGITLYNLEKLDSAKKALQTCLTINPFYSSAHFYLGSAYIKEGNLIPAMMAFKTYLLIAPEGKYSGSCVKLLNAIAKGTDDILEYAKKKKKSKTDNFDFLQEILLSKIALDKKYKLQADLEDDIVRQIQVVDEKLEYNRNDNGFAMQFYEPYFEDIFKSGSFEPMIFSMFSGLQIKDVDNWTKKNKKKIEAFATKSANYFLGIKTTRILEPSGRENAKLNYYYSGQQLLGRGAYSNAATQSPVGKWDIFYENGSISSVGNFDAAGKKDGNWISYYQNGRVKEKMIFKSGSQEGAAEGWYENGNKWYTETYRGDQLDGEQIIYFYNEKVRTVAHYKAGKKHGVVKYFNFKGQPTYDYVFADDNEEGPGRSFYPDGKLKNTVPYVKGKVQGTYKSYYNSGALDTQGECVNGDRDGLWVSNYEDGALMEKTTYKENDITGEYTKYYENGQLKEKGNYYKKKIDGKTENYDDDGKLFSDATYEKGKLRELNFYDKTGAKIATTTTRKGAANISFYSPDGTKISEGYFTRDGNKDGKFTEYFTSGKVRTESNYKEGTQEGLQTAYFSNGKKSYERSFKGDDVEGYQKVYYANGQLSSEAWIIGGKRQQMSKTYDPFGNNTSNIYYRDDELDGYSEYYYPNNILDYEYQYSNGWLKKVVQYDTTGKVLVTNLFDKGNGKLIYKHFNGKNLIEGNYENYLLQGPYNIFYFDGKPSSTAFYKADARDSIYKSYFYSGTLQTTGVYKMGSKDGNWKYYYDNGKLRSEENYKNGDQNGEEKDYYADGTLESVGNYKDDKLDGAFDIFDPKAALAVRLNYKNGTIKSYQYEGADGKLVAPILLKDGTGKVITKYKNGNPAVEFNYFENNLDGVRKIYYSTGKLYSEGTRLNGVSDGVNKTYYPTGTLWKQQTFVLGNRHGVSKTFFPDGKIEKEENFYNDEYHNVSKTFDAQGNVKQTKTFYYGYLNAVK